PRRRWSCPSCRSRRSRGATCGSHGRRRRARRSQPTRDPWPAREPRPRGSRPWPRPSWRAPSWRAPSSQSCQPLLGLFLHGLVSGIRLLGLLLSLRRHLGRCGRGTDAELALPDDGVQPRDVALDRTDAAVAVELAGGRLEAQVEQLFLGLAQLLDEALVLERVQL